MEVFIITDQQHCEEQLIKAFEMMWGKFPEPVMLIHRSRTILAVNQCCKVYGGVPGTKCNAVQPEKHAGCKANEALDKNETCISSQKIEEAEITSYWVPVSGVPDYFIHFGLGILDATKALQAVAQSESDQNLNR